MSEMELGQKVKAARLAQGMTMVELATICGLTKGFISQLESGASNPSLSTLKKIGAALRVPVSDLLDRADSRHLAERVATEITRPTVLHEAYRSAGRPGILPLASGPDGIHSLATVPAGSRLSHRGTTGEDKTPGNAVVTVVSGVIRVRQGQEVLELTRGAVASWDAGVDYTIEATDRTDASLVLFTPSGCSLPEYQASPGSIQRARALRPVLPVPSETGSVSGRRRGVPVGIQGTVQDRDRTGQANGPLRLVAMRAQRLAARRGQS